MEGELAKIVGGRIRPPLAIVLGSPREAADLAAEVGGGDIVCYQMDLHQAARLREDLDRRGVAARVVTAADLWDLPADFQTVVYPAPERGERILKIDMIEQAYHVLRPRGTFVVVSPYQKESFFPAALKKVFGRVHTPEAGKGTVFWCHREGERPRRRHELTYQARFGDGPSLRFLSRPGTFSYGRFDAGARALVETMTVEPGNAVLDIGCGCGTNGVCAGRLAGPDGNVTFVDSNVRAIALAEHNAKANGLTSFQVVASSTVEGLPRADFDVILANPPYYAQSSIAQLFIERGKKLLRPGGRFYLVTRQPDQVGPLVAEAFGLTEPVLHRGYTILCAGAEG